MRGSREAEIPVGEVDIDSAIAIVDIIGPVEQIEELEPELEIDAFRNFRVFVEVDVGLDEIRPAETHGLLVAFLAKSGHCEIALGNGTRQP